MASIQKKLFHTFLFLLKQINLWSNELVNYTWSHTGETSIHLSQFKPKKYLPFYLDTIYNLLLLLLNSTWFKIFSSFKQIGGEEDEANKIKVYLISFVLFLLLLLTELEKCLQKSKKI